MTTLCVEETRAIVRRLGAELGALGEGAAGALVDRQPVHTVYGGGHLFKRDVAQKLGRIALAMLAEHAPDAASFRDGMGLSGGLAHAERVRDRVALKLAREPVEDYRVDFEDGYGHRPPTEEDDHAVVAARELAQGAKLGLLPAFSGLRIKALNLEVGARALRTLDLFMTTLVTEMGGSLPSGFVVTLPKVQLPSQLGALCDALAALEAALGLQVGATRVEVMVEQTLALFGADGRLALPAFRAVCKGRLRGAHLGAYDYTSACGVAASEQDLLHPACDFARQIMQVSLAGTGVMLADGATLAMPVGPHRAPSNDRELQQNKASVHAAWRLHFSHVRRAMAAGFYQGWDLHPGQLVARHAAVIAFFIEGREAATERLRNFVEQAARATRMGSAFDDAATGQGLLNFFLRGYACGALDLSDVNATGLQVSELESRSFLDIVRLRRP